MILELFKTNANLNKRFYLVTITYLVLKFEVVSNVLQFLNSEVESKDQQLVTVMLY